MIKDGRVEEALIKMTSLRSHYDNFIYELYSTPDGLSKGK
jgi:hypothetical protein